MRSRIPLLLAVAAVAASASLAGHYIYSFATGSKYSVNQWMAAGAWVGALATFSAVFVALHQTRLARQNAQKQLTQAKEELAASETRLASELEMNRAHEIVKTIPVVWAAIDELGEPIHAFESALTEYYKRAGQGSARANLDSAASALSSAIGKANHSFSTPLMLVTERTTQVAIGRLYEDVRSLGHSIIEIASNLDNGLPNDVHRLRTELTEINSKRSDITLLVREHILKAPPLSDPYQRDAPTDPPATPPVGA